MLRALFCLSFVACAPYSIIKQAETNPLAEAKGKLRLEAIDFSRVMLNGVPEADFLARTAAASEFTSYDTDKRKLDANFRLEVSKQLAKFIGGGDDAYKVIVHAVNLRPGRDLNFENGESGVQGSTTANFVVDLCDADKNVLDRISVEVGMAQTAAEPLASQRVRAIGTKLGEVIAAYLKTRAGI